MRGKPIRPSQAFVLVCLIFSPIDLPGFRNAFSETIAKLSQLDELPVDAKASPQAAPAMIRLKFLFQSSLFLNEFIRDSDLMPLIIASMHHPPVRLHTISPISPVTNAFLQLWLVQACHQRIFHQGSLVGNALLLGIIPEIMAGSNSARLKYPAAVELEVKERKKLEADVTDPYARFQRQEDKEQKKHSGLSDLLFDSKATKPILTSSAYYIEVQKQFGLTILRLLSAPDRIKFYAQLPSFYRDLEMACSPDMDTFVAACLLKQYEE